MNQNNKEPNVPGTDRLDSSTGVTRREFLGMTAATLFVGGTLPDDTKSIKNGIPYRPLGHTGESVSLVGLGGYHLGRQSDPEESVRIIRTGLGDNCWDYNGGGSEIRMGKALRDGYRQKAFLMSKIDGRTKAAASSQINESLRRLQTDHLDLLQFHEVIRDRGAVLLPLLSGLYAEVHLKVPAQNSTFLLPVNCLLFRTDTLQVGVVKNGKITITDVTPGHDLGEEIEIVAGLKPDDQLVVNPPDSLVTGQEVRIVQTAIPGDIK